jgi:hypothetical protein
MKRFLHFAAGALLIAGTALSAQQTQTPSEQDQSVYQQQNPQDRNADQSQMQNQDRDQNWNRAQQTHRDRDQNWNNGQYADQDRDRVNQYNQYDNGQNGTYSDQDRTRDRDREQNGYNRHDPNGRQQDRERTYGYSGIPQSDQDNSSITPAQRSGWRDGLQAGREDRQSGRTFAPNASANRYRGAGQEERDYRQAFRQGYRRGYYGNNSNSDVQRYEH